jgi:hypothetical protein
VQSSLTRKAVSKLREALLLFQEKSGKWNHKSPIKVLGQLMPTGTDWGLCEMNLKEKKQILLPEEI